LQADLLEPGWAAGLTTGFDAVAALAVLHHIPAETYRVRLVAQCAELLRPRGIFIVSTWQFLGTPRLRTRILPWSRVGLKDEDVEPGDYLLSWGAGAAGQRYCAAIGEEDLRLLATEAGLAPVEMLYADGHEGNLSLYGVFRKLSAT
jgi:SAM-dependent methyltransferase